MAEISGGEDRLLEQLHRRSGGLNGDDAAILPDAAWAVTTDTQIAGTHYPEDLDPARVAKRLLAVNLSDLAAMGAVPAFAFLVLAAPKDYRHQRFLEAFEDACNARGVRLAGGDLSSQPHPMAVATLLGRQVEGGRWLGRDGARAGHRLWLGGKVGESSLGQRLIAAGARPGALGAQLRKVLTSEELESAAELALRRHLRPEPQLELGQWLARQPEGGAIDISDGLGKDLARLCRASGLGVEVHADQLPKSAGFAALCRALEVDLISAQLGGGEDYVLLFSLPPDLEPPSEFGCQVIGNLTATRDLTLIDRGQPRPLPTSGWDHIDT